MPGTLTVHEGPFDEYNDENEGITMNVRRIAALLLSPLILAGCLGDRSTGAIFDDQNIELRVVDAIYDAEEIDRSSHIKVEVFENVVLLMGETTTEANKALAGRIAADVDQVDRVVNEIEVGDRVGFGGKTSNSWMTAKVETALASENRLEGWDPYRIKVISSQGTVYLMGTVTRSEGDEVADVARNVRGVEKVVKVFNYIDEP
jgi:osmotically-inducible protein OsmY